MNLRINDMKKNFNNRCYEILALIPKGKISTYAEIAKALNSKAYRAVGNAMAKNSNLISIPCHRVIKSNGIVGGYALGTNKKINLLKKEGVTIKEGKVIDFKNIIFTFKINFSV